MKLQSNIESSKIWHLKTTKFLRQNIETVTDLFILQLQIYLALSSIISINISQSFQIGNDTQ